METGQWDEPVTFETSKHGQFRTIASTVEAAHVLISQWPHATGKAYAKAQKACLGVLEGRKKASAARKAFVKAAAEASVFIKL